MSSVFSLVTLARTMVIRSLLKTVTLFRIRLRVDDINDVSTKLFDSNVKLRRLREMYELLCLEEIVTPI